MRIFSEHVTQLWSLWEIRGMVLASFVLQAFLLLTSNRRKCSSRIWLRLLWLAYLVADSAATISLSVISSKLKDKRTDSPDPNQIITAFWAPFLVLHLGGPDTITAYSMEDNELWQRHVVVLVAQVYLACDILVTAWGGHKLNLLAIPVFIIGTTKFLERILVLRSASSKNFKESMFPPPDPGPNYARFMDDFRSNKQEGHEVTLEEEAEAPATGGYSSFTAPNMSPNASSILHHASVFVEIFRRLFADLILSKQDVLNSRSFFQNRSCNEAFQVIEIELGLMYDLFYTKAVKVYSFCGVILRLGSFLCMISVSVAFTVHIDKKGFETANLIITYVLLAGTIILEVCAIVIALCSDRTMLWLNKQHNKALHYILRPLISSHPSAADRNKRWSNVISQFNLISFCCEEEPMHWKFLHTYNISWIYKKFKKNLYKNRDAVPPQLKDLIFQQLIMKSRTVESWKKFCSYMGEWVLEKDKYLDKLRWSIEEEFDKSILLWHIATDLCYYDDINDKNKSHLAPNKNPLSAPSWKASKLLSQYLLYLLVVRPYMLPNGIGQIRFQDTCAEASEFFEQRKCKGRPEPACEALLKVSTETFPAEVKGDKSKSVLFDACRLAKELQSLETDKNWENQKKWELISHVWVEKLSYAASQCQWNHHAQRLSRGGELLTHVWLLMAHLGMTEQFQISKGYARARWNVQ